MSTVAIDATYAVDPHPSGVGVYSRRLVESLAEIATSHRFLVCYRLSRWKRHRRFLHPTASAGGSERPVFSTRLVQEPLTFWLRWQADLFHSLGQRPPAFRFKREVVTVFDTFPVTGRDYSTPAFQRRFSSLLREAVKRAARVITLSKYTAEQLAEHCGAPPGKIRVTAAGVDPPTKIMSADERLRERARMVGAGNEMVLSVGFIQTRKNTLGACRALALLPENFHLVLAGANGYGSEGVHEYIRRERLERRISVLGYVEADRMSSLYQAASVFLFPSFEEGFGIPVLEAMANEVPVVASRTSSLPEVGGDAAVYVDPCDVDAITREVRRVAEDGGFRDTLIRKGLARASEFTWQRTAEQTVKVYDEVLGLRNGGA